MRRTSVLFVCLGNICRSPLAEGVFRHLVHERGLDDAFDVDSAGTGGWHEGEAADPRSRAVAAENGIRLTSRARKLVSHDFDRFDWIIAMDRQNLRDIERLATRSGSRARMELMRTFGADPGDDLDVPDPYYGGEDGFQLVFEMVREACEGLLEAIEAS